MLRKVGLFSLLLGAAASLLVAAVWAQQQTAELRAEPRREAVPKAVADEQSYRVGPGDLLDIRVFGHPEMGREARVDTFGRIRLPFLGDLQAACLTEAQLSKAIEERFRKYLRDPQVDVLIKDYQSQPVAVLGSVGHPGRFLLQRRVRLLELLALAGGANLGAGSSLHLIRSKDYDFCSQDDQTTKPATKPTAKLAQKPDGKGPDGTPSGENDDKLFNGTFMVVNLHNLMNGAAEANLFIEPGDIISVPEADQIFLTGGVMRPGPIPLRQATTLLQAIGIAGGFYPDAAKNRIRILRQVPGSTERKEEIYDYEAIQKRKAKDVALQPNDLVEVPSSTAKSMGRGLMGLVVPTLGQLPLRVVRPY
jgi:polysaccharide biosynthesis/export protein